MGTTLMYLTGFWWIPVLVLLAIFYKLILRVFGVVIVPQNMLGVVSKRFVILGRHRSLPEGNIIALEGEAGSQADTLPPGVHYFKWPWQFNIRFDSFKTIEDGHIGKVTARDGKPLPAGRVLAKKIECNSFQDARAFLQSGGERGPQITVVPPGTYRFNTDLFTVEKVAVREIKDNMVGVVTTREGKPLNTGEIAGREIPGHNSFQDGQAFLDGGGSKGMQEQIILAGRYYLNPDFVTIEEVPMQMVPIAMTGVVIAFVGEQGQDVSGTEFKHGNLVSRGQKGVWVNSLDPGKYPINPYTHKVEPVSTANIVLNWATGKTEAHNLDKNLSTITVRSSDGFKFNLDVSQIIHIPSTEAPKVIARFGTVANLVTQVLEPTIGNYFRNTAQGSDVIAFLLGRQERQAAAKAAISDALKEYNVVAVDTLIGDITPPDELMKTLTDRKLAEQEKITYNTQKEAQEIRKQLQQAQAQADTQPNVVKAERDVEIASFNAEAMVKKAEGDAKSKTINAQADANVLVTVGAAEGSKITAVGEAEAKVIQLKTNAVGQQNYATIEVARSLSSSGFKLVPDVVAGGTGNDNATGGIVNVLMAGLLQKHLDKAPAPTQK